MELTDKTLAALISAGVSVVIMLVGIIVTSRKLKQTKDEFRHSAQQKYIDLLYEKRIEYFPEAFRISSRIKKKKLGGINKPKEILEIKEELIKWVEEKGALFLSYQSIEHYRNLKEVLGKRPGNNDCYQDSQVDKIWEARNKFLASIRKDVSIIHFVDNNKLPE